MHMRNPRRCKKMFSFEDYKSTISVLENNFVSGFTMLYKLFTRVLKGHLLPISLYDFNKKLFSKIAQLKTMAIQCVPFYLN